MNLPEGGSDSGIIGRGVGDGKSLLVLAKSQCNDIEAWFHFKQHVSSRKQTCNFEETLLNLLKNMLWI